MGNRLVLTLILSAVTIAPSAFAETLYIKASVARLRSSPSLDVDDTIVGRVAQNRTVEVLERKKIPGKGVWVRVKYGKKNRLGKRQDHEPAQDRRRCEPRAGRPPGSARERPEESGRRR